MTGSLDRTTAHGRIHWLLKDGRWHTARELHEVAGYDYRARVSRLRKLGFKIVSRPIPKRPYYQYQMEVAL